MSYCLNPTPFPEDRSRSRPRQAPQCSYGCSHRCPGSRGLGNRNKKAVIKVVVLAVVWSLFWGAVWELLFLTAEFLIRAIWAVISAIAKFLCRQADGGVVGTHVVRKLTHQRLAVFFIWVVLAVTVTVTNPGFADAACCQQKAGLALKYATSPHLTHFLISSPESLQPNLTAGSHMCVTPSHSFSSLMSIQSVSPSQRQRKGMHSPSMRHWNSSVWQPPGGRLSVEGAAKKPEVCFWSHFWINMRVWMMPNAAKYEQTSTHKLNKRTESKMKAQPSTAAEGKAKLL